MSLDMIYAQKGVAALIKDKLQKSHPDRRYFVVQRAQGWEIEFGYTAQPTGSFSTPEDNPAPAKATVTPGLTMESVIAKVKAIPAPKINFNPQDVFAQVAAVAEPDGSIDPLKMAHALTGAGASVPKKSAPQAAKPGTATGAAINAPTLYHLLGDDMIAITMPFRGVSEAYVDAYHNGKPISFGRKKIASFEVDKVIENGIFITATVRMVMSIKFAKLRGLL